VLPPYGWTRIEKPFFSTVIFAGMTAPTTSIAR
jgi:hypothetical protein